MFSGTANLDGFVGGVTNAGFNAAAGTGLFLDEKWAVGVGGKYRWAPLSQSMEASVTTSEFGVRRVQHAAFVVARPSRNFWQQ